jgi:hypothetical protein
MWKEMPVIPVNRVVDMKRIMEKREGQGGGEAQGVADPKRHWHLLQPELLAAEVVVVGVEHPRDVLGLESIR